MEDLAPAVGPHTMIVPLLKRHAPHRRAGGHASGRAPVLGGVCRICRRPHRRWPHRADDADARHQLRRAPGWPIRSCRASGRADAGGGVRCKAVPRRSSRRCGRNGCCFATFGGICCLMRGTVRRDPGPSPAAKPFIDRFLGEVHRHRRRTRPRTGRCTRGVRPPDVHPAGLDADLLDVSRPAEGRAGGGRPDPSATCWREARMPACRHRC